MSISSAHSNSNIKSLDITPIPDVQAATATDKAVTCAVSGLASPGWFTWEQGGVSLTSDNTNYLITSDSTLSNNEQKSILTVTVVGMTGLSTTSTFACVFESSVEPTSPVGEEIFIFSKLTYSKLFTVKLSPYYHNFNLGYPIILPLSSYNYFATYPHTLPLSSCHYFVTYPHILPLSSYHYFVTYPHITTKFILLLYLPIYVKRIFSLFSSCDVSFATHDSKFSVVISKVNLREATIILEQ